MSEILKENDFDAAAGSAPDGFMPGKPKDDATIDTSGHKPGKLVGNDAAPEFHLETLPAGTAPADKTFQPQNDSERPENPDAKAPTASETIGGSTSK